MFNLNEGLWFYIVKNNSLTEWKYILLTVSFAFIAMAAGYLLGSINSAIVISKVLYKDDIRKYGSGNAGLTNMLRTYGKKAAGLTLLGDILKTALAIVIGSILGGFGYLGGISLGTYACDLPLNYMAGFFAVIGHILPIYYGFKGGKGVLCTSTMALILTPIEFSILLLVFILIVWWSKYVSLGSVTVAVLYPIIVSGHIKVIFNGTDIKQNGVMALITIVLAIIIVYCHRGNLQRISDGTERKLSFKSKKNGTESK
ncbi:MAG: glycerol-3-phosphate 1-O-acyltransferase PlsY [Ruminococcaceae bacterium]|nr:glycerol-3-phosphate 1-O-acyltransferase PlsY [Oscillospiraceae bacterium]